jgi:hypothetical protein
MIGPDDWSRCCTLVEHERRTFVNVTTWADSLETAREKLSRYLESFKWHLISIEDAHPIDETRLGGGLR